MRKTHLTQTVLRLSHCLFQIFNSLTALLLSPASLPAFLSVRIMIRLERIARRAQSMNSFDLHWESITVAVAQYVFCNASIAETSLYAAVHGRTGTAKIIAMTSIEIQSKRFWCTVIFLARFAMKVCCLQLQSRLLTSFGSIQVSTALINQSKRHIL